MSCVFSKKKVVIIGAGMVGSTIAYTILLSNIASEIVLIDINRDRSQGEALDMNHGLAFFKQVTIKDGDYIDCADADVIIITAGVPRKPRQTRIELAKTNVAIVKDITHNIMKHAQNPILLVISNPVDILTYIVQKESGLAAHRVLGSGTALDTGRLRYLLSRHCNIDVRNMHAYIIGEHGDSEFPVWSRANIAGKPFDEYCEECGRHCGKINRDKIFEKTKNAGAEIISKKGATYYGIAMAVSRIVGAVINNENSVLTVSHSLCGEYGLYDVALSLPCIVNRNGVDRIVNLLINDEEMESLKKSAEKLKSSISDIYK